MRFEAEPRRRSGVVRGGALFLCLLWLVSCGKILGLEDGTAQGVCSTDAECAPGYGCLQQLGCRNRCSADSDCGAGSRCFKAFVTTACIPVSEGCGTADGDFGALDGCPTGSRCDGTVCRTRCAADDECAGGQVCTAGACIGTDPKYEVAGGAGGMSAGGAPGAGGASHPAGGGMSAGGTSGSAPLGNEAGSQDEAGAAGAPATGGLGTGGAAAGGATGSAGAGTGGSACTGAACDGCTISGKFYASGAGRPDNVICQSCDPATSTSAWALAKDSTSCGAAQVCSTGVCKAGCFVEGAFRSPGAGQPNNTTCNTCAPATSTTAWTAASDGTVCPTNQYCHNGACQAGCFISGTLYASGAVNGCQSCQPSKSATAWTNADGIACNGGTCCSGSCVNTQTSNTHCGGCGLACSTTCTSGECLVSQCASWGALSSGIQSLAVDAKNAYATHSNGGGAGLNWVSLSTCTQVGDSGNGGYEAVVSVNASASGVVFTAWSPPWTSGAYDVRLLNAAGTSSTKLAAAQTLLAPLTTDTTNVYWLDSTAGFLKKAPISGSGTVTQLAPIGGAGGIAVDGTYVYWSDSSSINRVPIAGGTADTLVSGIGSPGFIALDATNLYYMAVSNAIYRLPLGTTTPTTLANSQGTVKFVVMAKSTLYWSTGTQINSLSLSGGALSSPTASPIRVLYTFPASAKPFGLGVSGNSLYWADTSTFSLMRLTPL